MNTLRNTLAIILIPLSGLQLKAQENKGNKPIQDIVVASFSNTNYSTESFSNDGIDSEVGLRELKGSIRLPIYMNHKKISIIGGGTFSHMNLDLSNNSYIPLNSRDFYSFGTEIVAFKNIGKKSWKGIIHSHTFVASDMKQSISGDDIYYSIMALASKRKSKDFEYGFGFIFGNKFGGTKIYPILKVNYRKNNWETNVSIPVHASQFYNFKKFKLGISSDLANSIYSVDNDFSTEYDIDKISNFKFNVGPEFETTLYKKIKLNVKSGMTLGNKYEFLDKDTHLQTEVNPDNSLFFRVGLKLVH